MIIKYIRKGIKDVWWRPYMVKGARFSTNDIPICPTTSSNIPVMLITYKEAKEIYRKEMRRGNKFFTHLAYVCFYEDDSDFDSIFLVSGFAAVTHIKYFHIFQELLHPIFLHFRIFLTL